MWRKGYSLVRKLDLFSAEERCITEHTCAVFPSGLLLWDVWRIKPVVQHIMCKSNSLFHLHSFSKMWCSLLFYWQEPFRRHMLSASHLFFFFLLRLFFSMRLSRFSSLLLASSTSWCSRHLWKFSTTTPTNMFSTKKLTIRRNEMKYSSIQGLLLVMGWKMKRERTENERVTKDIHLIFWRKCEWWLCK